MSVNSEAYSSLLDFILDYLEIVLVSVVFLIGAVLCFLNTAMTKRVARENIRVTGRVISVSSTIINARTSYTIMLDFIYDERQITASLRTTAKQYAALREGDVTEVLVDRKKPTRVLPAVSKQQTLLASGAVMLIIGLAACAVEVLLYFGVNVFLLF